MSDGPLNARGRREVRLSLIDAAKRAKRRADYLRARAAAFEAEIADLDKIVSAIGAVLEFADSENARGDT